MGRRGHTLAIACAALALAACGLPTPADPAAVTIVGAGHFACGNGFHACSAWVSIRPANAPGGGRPIPTIGDAELRPVMDGSGELVVEGAASGGPSTLAPGDYRAVLTWIEISDQEPFALPSPGFAGTGIIGVPMTCDQEFPVAPDTVSVAITAIVGPGCGITVETQPGP